MRLSLHGEGRTTVGWLLLMVNRNLVFPNFIVAGGWKCGSTALCDVLSQHPDIAFTSKKEPNFFTHHYSEGLEFYSHLYPGYRGERAVGEGSVGYLQDHSVPWRIRRLLPNVRFVFILRNPVDRTISHHYWRRANGRGGYPISALLAGSDERCVEIRCSRYGTCLKPYLEYFDRAQIALVVAERFRRSPHQAVVPVFRHLGVAENVEVYPPGVVNEAARARSQFIADRLSEAHRYVVRHGAGSPKRPCVTLLGRSLSGLIRANRRPRSPTEGRDLEEVRRALYHRLLPEIEMTESLLGVALDEWKLPPPRTTS